MRGSESDLAAFYDQEAAARAVRSIGPERVQRRTEFIGLLTSEHRHFLLEIGTGPGHDAARFVHAGIFTVGIDLSLEHARLAAGQGVCALRASMYALPFAATSFDAGWTMSTLVHVPDARFDEAMSSITSTVRVGAPLAIGMWGGLDDEFVSDFDEIQPPRFFSLRSHDRARAMLGRYGQLERFDVWSHPTSRWEYQYAIVRVGSR